MNKVKKKIVSCYPTQEEFDKLTRNNNFFLVVIKNKEFNNPLKDFSENLPELFSIDYINNNSMKIINNNESYLIKFLKQKNNYFIFSVEEDLSF